MLPHALCILEHYVQIRRVNCSVDSVNIHFNNDLATCNYMYVLHCISLNDNISLSKALLIDMYNIQLHYNICII